MTSLQIFSALSQGLIDDWSIPFTGSGEYVISHDGSQFALRISDTSVARYDGRNGNVLDTIYTPITVSADDIAYCGKKLFLMSPVSVGSNKDTTFRLCYIDIDLQPVWTSYYAKENLTSESYVNIVSIGLFSFPGQPFIGVRVSEHRSGGSSSTETGKVDFVDTATFAVRYNLYGEPITLSWSSDLKNQLVTTRSHTSDPGPSPDTYSYHWDAIEIVNAKRQSSTGYSESDYKGTRAPDGFMQSIHSGSRSLSVFSDKLSVHNTSPKEQLTLQNFKGVALASLYAPTILLTAIATNSETVLNAYNIANGDTKPLDTLESCTRVWVNGASQIVYASDTTAKVFKRYRMVTFNNWDTIAITASNLHARLFESVTVQVQPYLSNNTIDSYVWLVDDTTKQTTTPEIVVSRDRVDTVSTRISLIDSQAGYTRTQDGPTIDFRRPNPCAMVCRISNYTTRQLALSPTGSAIVANARDEYSIPGVDSDNALQHTWEYYASIGVAFVDSNTRLISQAWHTGEYSRVIKFLTQASDSSTSEYIDSFSMSFSGYNQAGQGGHIGKIFYHKGLDRWYVFYRAFLGDSVYPQKVGVWQIRNPNDTGTGHWVFNEEKWKGIYDVDHLFQKTILTTGSSSITSIDLETSDTLFTFWSQDVGSPLSAFQLNDTTIISSVGIIHKSNTWTLQQKFKFTDGIQSVRMNDNFTFILRKNADTIGCIINNHTGNVFVQKVGEGFGLPRTAVFDPVTKRIHIGDEWGLIATYNVPSITSVNEQPPLNEEGIRVQYSTSSTLLVNTPFPADIIEVYSIVGEVVQTQQVEHGETEITVNLADTLSSGAYFLVVRNSKSKAVQPFIVTQ